MSSQLHNSKCQAVVPTKIPVMSACEMVRKKSVREKAREILILSFSRSKTSPIKSGKTWQQLTSKVSYLYLACAKDDETNAGEAAAEQKMAGVSDRSQDEKTENGNLKAAAGMEITAVIDRSKIATCDVASPPGPVATEHSLFVSDCKVQVVPNSSNASLRIVRQHPTLQTE